MTPNQKVKSKTQVYIDRLEDALKASGRHFAPGGIYNGKEGAGRLAREIGQALAESPDAEVSRELNTLYSRLLVRFTFGSAGGVPVSAGGWTRAIWDARVKAQNSGGGAQ